MKKILLLIDSLEPGGAQRQLAGLACGLKQKGFDVKVVTYHRNDFYLPLLQKEGVAYENISGTHSKLKRLTRLWRAVREYSPDAVISYLNMPSIYACLLKKRAGARWRLIVSERNTTQSLSLMEKLKFRLYRVADVIVPNSHAQAEFIANHYPLLRGKTTVITNFTDTDEFAPDTVKTSPESQVEARRIICVGRVVPQKNLLRFIEALSALKKSGRKFRVDWFGSRSLAEYVSQCDAKVAELGLKENIRFHEPSVKISDEYNKADIFCLPSVYEGFPNVLCEAMSCGLPVVCGDVCDNAKIADEGKSGYLFDPLHVDSMVAAIDKMLASDQRIMEEMGVYNRHKACAEFSIESFLDKYITLLSDSGK